MPARQTQRCRLVLKICSGDGQGTCYPIEVGRDTVIGRALEADIVIPDAMASRKHARVFVKDGQIQVEDLGSSNGSFVNGQRISKVTRLDEDDEVVLGATHFKLAPTSPREDRPSPVAVPIPIPPVDDKKRKSVEFGEMTLGGAGWLAGLIEQVGLPDLLQLISMSKKSGVLVIKGKRKGKIYLRDGRAYFAKIDGHDRLPPQKALFRIFGWTTGQFMLEKPSDESFPGAIDLPLEALMLEGLRQLDEIQGLGTDVPDLEARLVVERAIGPGVTPEMLDIIRLFSDGGRVIDVLDESPKTDLETLQAIVHLVKVGCLRVA